LSRRLSYVSPMRSRGRATLGDTVIDFDRMEIRNTSQSIPATSLEFRVLKLFIDNPNRVFSRKELIRAVWKKRKRASLRTVDTLISRLRRKLEKNPVGPIFFQTVHGTGYRLVSTGLTSSTSSTHGIRARTGSDSR
jgi:DNA-binding response OmpR family regulator